MMRLRLASDDRLTGVPQPRMEVLVTIRLQPPARQSRQSIVLAFRPTVFDRYVLAFGIAHFDQALPKSDQTTGDVVRFRGAGAEKADLGDRLLPASTSRPGDCSAKQGHEKVTGVVMAFSRPVCPYPALPRYSGVGDMTKASSFACVDDSDRDDNQPPAPKYLNDGDNYPIVPIDDQAHAHDGDQR
jgi:hypothetical protein